MTIMLKILGAIWILLALIITTSVLYLGFNVCVPTSQTNDQRLNLEISITHLRGL